MRRHDERQHTGVHGNVCPLLQTCSVCRAEHSCCARVLLMVISKDEEARAMCESFVVHCEPHLYLCGNNNCNRR